MSAAVSAAGIPKSVKMIQLAPTRANDTFANQLWTVDASAQLALKRRPP